MLELKNQELLAILAQDNSKYTSEITDDKESSAENSSDNEKRKAAIEALIKKAKLLQDMYNKLLEENNR